MKSLISKQETRSKGIWQIVTAISPLLLTGIIVGSSSNSGGAMVGVFLLAIFSIPCLILFILGVKNLYGVRNLEVIKNNQDIENKGLLLSIKIVSWITLITFSPLLFRTFGINLNSLCLAISLGLSLYIIVFGCKKWYRIILFTLIILYGYIFYEIYQSGCLCIDQYTSWKYAK